MIYLRSTNFLSIFPKGILLFAILNSCSLLGENLHPIEEKKLSDSAKHKSSRTKAYFGQMQWAVQNYEAGEYKKAIQQFDLLRTYGTEVPNYELIHFYIGMSYFRLEKLEEAKNSLNLFLQQNTLHHQNQEARITLLSIYEKQSKWDDLLGLAAEMEKLTLFQNNRAFLKLVWAKALVAKGENKGATLLLKESLQYLDSGDYRPLKSMSPDTDLWGRYYYTQNLLKEQDCISTNPKSVGSGKNKRNLYLPWLENAVDCYASILKDVSENLIQKESNWSDEAMQNINQSFLSFEAKIQSFLKKERPHVEKARALSSQARQNLYRLLGKMDELQANVREKNLNTSSLKAFRTKIDQTITQIAAP
jgi:tetratricopeptide (TPR) repeat protein